MYVLVDCKIFLPGFWNIYFIDLCLSATVKMPPSKVLIVMYIELAVIASNC